VDANTSVELFANLPLLEEEELADLDEAPEDELAATESSARSGDFCAYDG